MTIRSDGERVWNNEKVMVLVNTDHVLEIFSTLLPNEIDDLMKSNKLRKDKCDLIIC